MNSEQLQTEIISEENAILARHNVVARLSSLCGTKEGIQEFSRLFYPLRSSFVQIAFTVGARCPSYEDYWAGLAENLYEEAGGGKFPTHNELYRRFMASVGLTEAHEPIETDLSKSFNRQWLEYARTAPLDEAVAAIALYEILDVPDYSALFESLDGQHPEADLIFFKVHSKVEHFSMFANYFDFLGSKGRDVKKIVEKAGKFMFDLQNELWGGLLRDLENAETKRLSRAASGLELGIYPTRRVPRLQ